MARPIKTNIDYFPHDSRASEGDTLTIIEGQFGIVGYAFWFKLLERISCADNLVIDVRNPAKWELLAAKIRITPEDGLVIMDKLAELDAIDAELWREHKIIWCQNLVDRVVDAYRNRKHLIPQKPVIDVRNRVSDVRNPAISPKTPEILHEMPQRERKGKERKGNKKEINKEKKSPPQKYGEFQNVLLTDQEFQKLKSRFPGDFEKRIENLSTGIASKGYKYVDHYAAILRWAEKDFAKENHEQHPGSNRQLPETYADPEDIRREYRLAHGLPPDGKRAA
jgi:hypothetical protein